MGWDRRSKGWQEMLGRQQVTCVHAQQDGSSSPLLSLSLTLPLSPLPLSHMLHSAH